MLTKAPRGTGDILPGEVERWQYLEEEFRKLCRDYNYKEIRTPIFEHTELFVRSVGEDTDIVGKEMYTFLDKGDRSITLRPEGTAPTVRAYLQHKLYGQAQPVKLFYHGPMFRYDRPQAGRYRQFHQWGVEVFGSEEPLLDAEVISLAVAFFNSVGIEGLVLELNSVGCSECRSSYREEIRNYMANYRNSLCPDCNRRFETNPLRILDCKEKSCKELTIEIPEMTGHLCDNCRKHFSQVVNGLEAIGVTYRINPRLVRGLDYYTRTAFEIIDPQLGSQNSLGGGGRYDDLVEVCGGNPTPAVGFAIGMERVLLALKNKIIEPSYQEESGVFVAALGDKADIEGLKVVTELRRQKIKAEKDYLKRSLKAQMKQANKINTRYVVIMGEEELEKDKVLLRDMQEGHQWEVARMDITACLKEKMGR
ncbi:MAG: histidine--tRNA ligase [Candidatus Syntrophonatronum acetioxidans]|uniref:Histidine--tRNA ligase n=1 Tax=Candidatus Syntrophonatronum acetioxidans TaxID=1795816 RepID=A0A424YIJ7_9FIRM|nr:MAG: histidine--tRNA ligase [Candidatus Syntrophonatronum acetioxidans]